MYYISKIKLVHVKRIGRQAIYMELEKFMSHHLLYVVSQFIQDKSA